MISDKEVGELWRRTTPNTANPLGADRMIRDLIRKLVEERAKTLAANYDSLPDSQQERARHEAACRDFGIDPDSYTKEERGNTK